MQPPKVLSQFPIPDFPHKCDRFTRVYKLIKNLYGLKDAGRTWNHHLRKGLLKRGWKQSTIDECLFIKQGLFLTLYVMTPVSSHTVNQRSNKKSLLFKKFTISQTMENFKIIFAHDFNDTKNDSVTLTQPRMIERFFRNSWFEFR